MAETNHTVVGAGPSGCAAAITVARAGQRVAVLERHGTVGGRFHGDMQGLENWSSRRDVLERIRGLGIEVNFPYRGFDEVTFYGSKLRPVTARTSRPLFYLVRRGPGVDTLDTGLLRQAQRAGADVQFGVTARIAQPGAVVATGPAMTHAIATGLHFSTPLADQAHVIVHPVLAPAGYAYLLVWDGEATLATCLFRDFRRWREARDATVEAFRRLLPALRLADARAFGGYGAVLARPRYTDPGGRLFVGEAAGLQDAEWGFGILTALRSGVLAAHSILDGTDYPAKAHEEFDAVRDSGVANRAMFETLPTWVHDLVLGSEAAGPDLRARLRRHWAPNPAKTLIAEAARRHAGVGIDLDDPYCAETSCLSLHCVCARRATPAAVACSA